MTNGVENAKITSNEFYAYLEDEFDLSTRFSLNAGIHTSGYLVEGKSYFSFQPRLSARFMVNEGFSLKAGYAKMAQYMHLLTSSGIP